ncbi:hypothetical protein [Magnetospirillum sp. SS-4]|uniref:hypothetical protein n=1 Tax=Magnetospirillum sp. SS-4 TaxID=2681465 RepID=UPI0013846912|nr:hypothetical protein [Magnetospirillum sp. SS-4]CAA7614443.1 conserved hypothetical protein [Magnetospirillum sp. SS-4]
MFVGSPAERGYAYTPLSGRGEAVAAAVSPAASGAAAAADAVPLINPAINYDYRSGIAVLEIRDPDTGEVEVQYPSKKVVQEYIRQGAASKDAPHPTPAPDQAAAPPVAALSPVAAPATAAPTAPAPASPEPAHTDQTA